MRPFHLAFPVDDLEKTREFYTKTLGCKEGRSSQEEQLPCIEDHSYLEF